MSRLIWALLSMGAKMRCVSTFYIIFDAKSETILRKFRYFSLISEDFYRFMSSPKEANSQGLLKELLVKMKRLKGELLEPNRRKGPNSLNSVKTFTIAA